MIKNLETMKNAALAILKNAVKIIKFALLGRGKTPWVHYEDREGKRYATFLKKSEFQGYSWNDDYSKVTNLETGEIYQVSSQSCTCKDWEYRVKPGKKDKCKHQLMREEFIKDEVTEIEITQEELPTGCFTRKYDNSKSIEHRLYAYIRAFNGEEYYPKVQEVGKILISSFNGIEAWTNKGINGISFDSINDALNFLLRKINLKEAAEAYQYCQGGF